MFTKRMLLMITVALIPFIQACKIEIPERVIVGLQLGCSASLPANSGGSVLSGQPTAITISVTGGTGPYTISGVSNSFSGAVTVSRTYTNDGNGNISLSDQFSISDASGASASCSLVVTVRPDDDSTLACQFVANPVSPVINSVVQFTATASGGTAPYTFSDFGPGQQSSTAIGGITNPTPNQAVVMATYQTAGTRTATLVLTDDDDNSVTCSKAITVRNVPALFVAASPSQTVPAGNPVTLTATATDFASAPTFSFSTSELNVTVVQSGNTAIVRSTDNASHNFDVLVTATSTSGAVTETVNRTIALNFTPSIALTCSLTAYTSGYYYSGNSIGFRVNATSGENLEITSFDAAGGVVTQSSGSWRQVRFDTRGSKTLTATARSSTSGALCNAGTNLQTSITVRDHLSCSVTSSPNPSYLGEGVSLTTTVPENTGVAPYSINWFATSPDAFMYVWDVWGLNAWVSFGNYGSFPVEVNISDAAGENVSCSTTHVVWWLVY
ncbi:MAG: hypothetical protein HY537_08935 [Deltaproteobacteria bacterium]|nr:hypothetical protein [Deltaproteobacteria bacterium]